MHEENFSFGKRGPDNQFERHPTLSVTGEQLMAALASLNRVDLPTIIQHDKCGYATAVGEGIAATLVVQPDFYAALFCAQCKRYAERKEFRWYGAQACL